MQLADDEIARLSPPERLGLIEQLWDSLDEADVAVTPAQKAELARRMATFAEDRLTAVPWEDLKAELARRANH
jgi:putative addiction module component (TIGR02574 family)